MTGMVFFMKTKDEVFDKFKIVHNLIQTHLGRQIKVLRSDNGREFVNGRMRSFMEERGIDHQTTAPHTPEQNGVAERKNRTLAESARSMLFAKDLPQQLWAEAILTATYLNNRQPSVRSGRESPYELWFGRKPELNHLRIFGSWAYEHVPDSQRKKWQKKARKLMMVGYDSNSTNYRLLDMKTKKITISRHVDFNEETTEREKSKKYWSVVDMPVSTVEDDEEKEIINEEYETIEEEAEQFDKSEEQTTGGPKLRDRSKIKKPARYESHCIELDEPQNVEEALAGPEAKEWQIAIDEEMTAMENNNTWIPVDNLPKGCKAVTSKIVFKKKLNNLGQVERYKARLVARGFTQRPGIDYTETFAPVIRYESVRVLLSLAAKEDWDIVQFDIKTAFLNGDLEEEIYMELPTCVAKKGKPFVRLTKSIYGLKQSSRQWNKKFDKFLKRFEFKESSADKCVYTGKVENSQVVLALYVDDGLLMSTDLNALLQVIDWLKNKFEVTVGSNQYFVGLELKRDRSKRKLFIGQSNYLKRVIDKFNMTDAKSIATPAEYNTHLSTEMSKDALEITVPYREVVGSLIFALHGLT